jgi:hypothetical protein
MRLTDLSPHWIALFGWSAESQFYVGVSFLCPHCDPSAPEHGANRRRRLAVMFHPPIDPDNWLARILAPVSEGKHQRVSGETFDTLTLSPSIGFDHIGHWHGHIVNGAIL